jgi:hypothetical protein
MALCLEPAPASGSAASATARPIDGITAEYTSMVKATVLCPSRSLTAFGWTPAESRHL